MPLEQHPTDPDKMVYASRHYDIPQLQGVTTTQRTWVDLTDEEIDKTYRMIKRSNRPQPTPLEFARDLLTKFKEKNNG
jgi:hypothetical protein